MDRYHIHESSNTTVCNNTMVNGALWNDILDHPYHVIIEKVVSDFNCKISPKSFYKIYGSCKLGKSYKLHASHMHKRSVSTFGIIHMDLWGPFLS